MEEIIEVKCGACERWVKKEKTHRVAFMYFCPTCWIDWQSNMSSEYWPAYKRHAFQAGAKAQGKTEFGGSKKS